MTEPMRDAAEVARAWLDRTGPMHDTVGRVVLVDLSRAGLSESLAALITAAREEGRREGLDAVRDLEAFVAIMFGMGPDCDIPETVNDPLGIPIKLGDIMRSARAVLR